VSFCRATPRGDSDLPQSASCVPAGQLENQPHDRSPSARQIVWALTKELRSCLDAVVDNRAEWKGQPPPPFPEMLRLFEEWSNELTDRVAAMDEGAWSGVAQFWYDGKIVSEQPVAQFLWYIHFDAIHHRGQLSAYLRPIGGTVPSIYGPSADARGT
jgi:uncharacterized damage-inducible protein DinB